MSAGYHLAVRERAGGARLCFDPFHVVSLANLALDQVRREEWNRARRSRAGRARAIKRTRWALLKHPARLAAEQRETLALVRRHNRRLWRAYELKEMVRSIYHTRDVAEAQPWLDAVILAGLRGRLAPFRKLALTLREHREGILNAGRLRLSNSPLEGLNSRLQLLIHRAAGFHSASALIAMAMLCVGGFKPALPHQ